MIVPFKETYKQQHTINGNNQNSNNLIYVPNNILKKELLQKAKKALADNSKVNIGFDIKKI